MASITGSGSNKRAYSMKSLAAKYRPKTFSEVIGESSVIKILQKQIETNNIKNAYLFAGGSGQGKTSVARLYAREVNDGVDDITEIDAASNNGVEAVRNLLDTAAQKSIYAKYKVYIIDECHMLTQQAWQPFLKILEEMPTYTIFIFCTTDPQKVPETILNRVQRFNFKSIPSNDIKNRLEYVCQQEGFQNYDESIEYISKVCNGCMREALTLLDKIADYSTVLDIKTTQELLDIYSYDLFFDLTNAMIDDGGEATVINIIETAYNNGVDLKLFIDNYLKFIIDISKYILFNTIEVTNIPKYLEPSIKEIINIGNAIKYYSVVMDKLLELKNMLKNEVDVKSVVEVVCLQVARLL